MSFAELSVTAFYIFVHEFSPPSPLYHRPPHFLVDLNGDFGRAGVDSRFQVPFFHHACAGPSNIK
jgi:hypothetical protein